MCPESYQREDCGGRGGEEGAGRGGHKNRVQKKGDLICWSRKEGSQTWKGFLEEVAFTLGLE